MATYPEFTAEHCWTGVTSAEGWVRYSWAVANVQASGFGMAYQLAGDGYIKQQTKKILKHNGSG